MSKGAMQRKQPLRAGVILDGLKQQAWVDEVIRDLLGAGLVGLKLVAVCSGVKDRYPTSRGILAAYAAWDRRKFRPAFDALAEADVSWMLEGARRIDVCAQGEADAIALGTEAVESISACELDVVISFLAECPSDIAECRSTYGSWFFSIGKSVSHPGLDEVFSNKPVTTVRMLLAAKGRGPKVICECQGSTEPDSWRLNLSTSSWRLGDLLKRAVKRALEYGEEGLSIERDLCEFSLDKAARAAAPPALHAARLFISRAWAGVCGRLFWEEWLCAFRHLPNGQNPLDCLSDMVPIEQPDGSFLADPFPVRSDGSHVLFVEEATCSERRGRIVMIRVDENGHCRDHLVVLERPYHMSYPFVFHYEDDFYMIPQAANNGRVEMFKSVEFPTRWDYHSVVLQGEKFSDTTLLEHNGKWWLFTTPGTREILPRDDLLVFYSDTPFGPWIPHRRNPVISDARCARPAGRPFTLDGKLLRPAQDCSYRQYGRAITIREIVTLTEAEFLERDYKRIDPNWMPGLLKTHTFNFAGDLLVLDGCRRRWKR